MCGRESGKSPLREPAVREEVDRDLPQKCQAGKFYGNFVKTSGIYKDHKLPVLWSKNGRFNPWALEESLIFNLYFERCTDSADGTRGDLNGLLGAEDKGLSWNLEKDNTIFYSWNKSPGSGLNSLFLLWRCWPQNRIRTLLHGYLTRIVCFLQEKVRQLRCSFCPNLQRDPHRGSLTRIIEYGRLPEGHRSLEENQDTFSVCERKMHVCFVRLDQPGGWQMKPK